MTVIGSAELELRGNTAQFVAALKNASKQVEAFGRDVETKFKTFDSQFGKSFGAIGTRLQSFGRTLTTHVTLPLGLLGGGVIAAGTKMDTLRRALTAVAGSADEAEKQFAELTEVAKLPGLGLAEAVQGSVRLQAVGVSAAVAARSLKAFGNAIATTGGGRAEIERVTVQLAQMLAKGKILQQDLRFIIENAPAVGKALRDAFGTVDPQEIEALGLSTDQFLDALLTQLEKLPAVTGGPKNAFENLSDALLKAGDAISRTVMPGIVQLVDGVTSLLGKVEKLNPETVRTAIAFGAVALAMGPLVGIVGNLVAVLGTLVTVFSVGLGTALAVGGPLLVGLGLLAGLFIKNKLEALAAAGAAKTFGDQLRSMTKEQINEQIARLESLRDMISRFGLDNTLVKKMADQLGVRDPSDIRVAIDNWTLLRDRIAAANDEAGKPPPGGGAGSGILSRGNVSAFPLEQIIDRLDEARERLRDLQFEAALPQTAEDAKKLAEEIARTNAEIAVLERGFGSLGETAARALTREIVPILAQIQKPPVSGVGRGVTQINPESSIRASLRGIREMSTEMQAFGMTVANIAGSMGDAFVDFAFGARDAFRNFVRAALADLARLAARMLIVRAITAAFPGSAFVQTFFGLTPRAAGGPVMRNRPYLVGERGPELFVPRAAGDIVASPGAGAMTIRFGDLPPMPTAMTPEAVALNDWWRRAFSHLKLDYDDRGGL